MPNPTVSIGLPVFNGENFLAEALDSLLAQTYDDIEVVISDNGSTDGTEAICRRYVARDSRVRYSRQQTNTGASSNFNRVFELSSGPYFKWSAHDDVHLPDFVARCVHILEADPSVVLVHSRARSVNDRNETVRAEWSEHPALYSRSPQERFRQSLAPPANPIPLPIFGLTRSSVLSRTRMFTDVPDSDRALLSELSLHGPFAEIEDVLFHQREHSRRAGHRLAANPYYAARFWGEGSEQSHHGFPHWALLHRHAAGVLGAPITRKEKLACLGEVGRWAYRHRARFLQDLLVGTPWFPFGKSLHNTFRARRLMRRVRDTEADLYSWTPADATVILIDEDETAFGRVPCPKRSTLLFMEQDGYFSVNPVNDRLAVRELERLRELGGDYLAVGWSAFWWFDYYREFYEYLTSQHTMVFRNDRLALYRLKPQS